MLLCVKGPRLGKWGQRAGYTRSCTSSLLGPDQLLLGTQGCARSRVFDVMLVLANPQVFWNVQI